MQWDEKVEKGSTLMNKNLNWKGTLLLAAMAAAAAMPFAQKAAAADSAAVAMTVTAVDKKEAQPPALKKDDVQLYEGKERVQAADWKRGETLFLALLIDDSLDSAVANQWGDLKAFLMAQPENTYIAVAYARNGAAVVAQDFTKDHALAAKALRMPTGSAGAFTSPYLAVQDWMKRWPDSGERKSIMLFSSGVDYFRGSFDPVDPDLDTTISRAQKQNINIWTIYVPDAGHVGRRSFRVFNSQSNLSRLSEETGAESFYLGSGMPVTLKPYFDEIDTHLKNQYLLAFVGNGGKKGKFERVRVVSEVPNVEFLTPSEVFLPAVQ
jgi:VWFA-related protein